MPSPIEYRAVPGEPDARVSRCGSVMLRRRRRWRSAATHTAGGSGLRYALLRGRRLWVHRLAAAAWVVGRPLRAWEVVRSPAGPERYERLEVAPASPERLLWLLGRGAITPAEAAVASLEVASLEVASLEVGG